MARRRGRDARYASARRRASAPRSTPSLRGCPRRGPSRVPPSPCQTSRVCPVSRPSRRHHQRVLVAIAFVPLPILGAGEGATPAVGAKEALVEVAAEMRVLPRLVVRDDGPTYLAPNALHHGAPLTSLTDGASATPGSFMRSIVSSNRRARAVVMRSLSWRI